MSALMINLHQLRIFVAIVEFGSVRRAAEELHLTQPALSAQIRALRRAARTPIFAREGRRIVPTEGGLRLYEYARDMLAATEALERDLVQIGSGQLTQVVVAGNRAYGTYILPDLLSRFHLKNPGTSVRLLDATSEEVIDRVRHGEIDIGIVTPNQVPRELLVSHLGEDLLLVVESARHPISDGGTLSLHQVSQAPFIRTLIGQTRVGTKLEHMLLAEGLQPRRVVMELTTW
jgi:LysR family transcriptional regulator, low CO2-responsive transcriptional regulator